jgi:hypothetical protein
MIGETTSARMRVQSKHEPGVLTVSPKRIAKPTDHGPPGPEGGSGPGTGSRLRVETSDRDHLLERLQHLRGILPVFAQELASARRQAAALRVENRGLEEEVRLLRKRRGESSPSAATHR